MRLLGKRDTRAVGGGEVGATGMGDDLHYTGYLTGSHGVDCYVHSGGSLANWLVCMFW